MNNLQHGEHRLTVLVESAIGLHTSVVDNGSGSDQAGPESHLFQTPILSVLQAEEARLQALSAQRMASQTEDAPTEPLDEGSPDIISILSMMPSGFRIGDANEYISLPVGQQRSGLWSVGACWRIELHGLAPRVGPVGLDILGDVVLGRGPDADFDLDPYEGYEQAVSRRHAMLRPTRQHLHLLDLGSTNGTWFNSIPLARCNTYQLKHNDVITLGLFNFTVKIIDSPALVRA